MESWVGREWYDKHKVDKRLMPVGPLFGPEHLTSIKYTDVLHSVGERRITAALETIVSPENFRCRIVAQGERYYGSTLGQERSNATIWSVKK